jgi:hypothetical protein
MGLNSKQVAAIAEKQKQDSAPTEMPKAPSVKATGGLKGPPAPQKSKELKVSKAPKMAQPKFKINSIADLKKARQQLKGDY